MSSTNIDICINHIDFRMVYRLIPRYCWFSQDVTNIQTKNLSILPRFYFLDVLEQLKANFHTNFPASKGFSVLW